MTETAFQVDAFQSDSFQEEEEPTTKAGAPALRQPYFVIADIADQNAIFDARTEEEKRREEEEQRRRDQIAAQVREKVALMLAVYRARKAQDEWLLDLIDDDEYLENAA